ncbi:ABCG24 [Symbiodinium pilosum]|uniref:ABCG24 protein n=1 Tax=Symbiodinium pilosum TaxID=2952 RepID=A0A812M9D8_SYMPI|nr:ABCG24 [Symbiodinium pilosum]
MMGGILGLPMQMSTFLNGGPMEIVVDCISFTRWSAGMSFLEYITLHPPDDDELSELNRQLLNMFKSAYGSAHFMLDLPDGQWWTGVWALIAQGTVLRVVAYVGLRFTNRARQV